MMTAIKGPFAEIKCSGCGRWVQYNLGGTRHAEKRMDEIRELSRWYCAYCERFPSDAQRAERA
jgi:hypothetical protein